MSKRTTNYIPTTRYKIAVPVVMSGSFQTVHSLSTTQNNVSRSPALHTAMSFEVDFHLVFQLRDLAKSFGVGHHSLASPEHDSVLCVFIQIGRHAIAE
eukprot:5537777-Amphidinium_carterae.1